MISIFGSVSRVVVARNNVEVASETVCLEVVDAVDTVFFVELEVFVLVAWEDVPEIL